MCVCLVTQRVKTLKNSPARAIEHDFIIYFLKKMDDLSSMPFFFKK